MNGTLCRRGALVTSLSALSIVGFALLLMNDPWIIAEGFEFPRFLLKQLLEPTRSRIPHRTHEVGVLTFSVSVAVAMAVARLSPKGKPIPR